MSINIPENGRVVVVDDMPDDGLPLLRALSARGIPVTYFTGYSEELPDNPFPAVRILFLDIVLGREWQDDKRIIYEVIPVIGRIIDKEGGPFLIIAWTKHEELIEGLKKALKAEGYQFILVNLEKSKCKGSEGEYDLDTIENKLEENLREIGCFHLFAMWENLVHKASGKIVNDFSEFHDFDENWNANMSGVFLKLAEGFAGKQLDRSNNEQIVKNALFSFNSAFLDELEAEIRNYEVATAGLSFEGVSGAVDKEIIGDINSKLLLAMESSESILPGNVYDDIERIDIKELFNGNLDKSDKKDELLSQIVYIYLETSPLCDYAQDKWKVSRLLPGVLWPEECESNKIKKAGFIYNSPLIKLETKLYYMVFDLRFFTSIEFSKLKDKSPLFRLKHDYLVDIQSKLAPHINRPGVMSVE